MSVDIVVVNWNSGNQLTECIKSIIAFGLEWVNHIVVVDNGSTDNSLKQLPANDKRILIIRAKENLGFAKACNLGAAYCSKPYLLFLNPDARLMEGTLKKCIKFMDSESALNIGILGVRLIDERGTVQHHSARFPNWRTWVSHSLGISALFPNLFPSHFMIDFNHLYSRKVDHVMGAFFFVRRKLFQSLNGFDERYFVYLEDLDFSLRAKQAGWSTWYLADAIAFHRGGGTSEQVKAHRLFYSIRSRLLYAFKHFPRTQAWVVLGFSLLIEPVSRLVRAMLHRSGQEVRDTAYGYTLLWTDLPNILKKTKKY